MKPTPNTAPDLSSSQLTHDRAGLLRALAVLTQEKNRLAIRAEQLEQRIAEQEQRAARQAARIERLEERIRQVGAVLPADGPRASPTPDTSPDVPSQVREFFAQWRHGRRSL